MTSLKERSVFFPSQKFDGRNKDLTKQHWQAFQDFCNQQKLYIENTDDHRAATINEVQPFFKMTLTDLARAWIERETFTSPADLKEKFLRDFSPYGQTHRQWIAKWAALKFNPETDNIDEFIAHFEDLASLNNIQDDYKLHAFKIAMPREVELHLSRSNNLQDCYQTLEAPPPDMPKSKAQLKFFPDGAEPQILLQLPYGTQDRFYTLTTISETQTMKRHRQRDNSPEPSTSTGTYT